MIIDCHGHYTTAPKQLDDYRRLQLASCDCAPGTARQLVSPPVISDEAFLRRLSIDLQGRVPTTEERRLFLWLPVAAMAGVSLNMAADR